MHCSLSQFRVCRTKIERQQLFAKEKEVLGGLQTGLSYLFSYSCKLDLLVSILM